MDRHEAKCPLVGATDWNSTDDGDVMLRVGFGLSPTAAVTGMSKRVVGIDVTLQLSETAKGKGELHGNVTGSKPAEITGGRGGINDTLV
jgi:hypothetical protein